MAKRLKVLHVAPLPPPLGGMVTYIQGLLSSDVFKEIDYRVVRFSYIPKDKYRGLVRGILNILNAVILTIIFLGNILFWRPSIVHIQCNSGFGFFEKSWIAFLAQIFRRKTIFHFHGGNFVNFYQGSPNVIKKLIKRCALLNNRILTGSPQMKENWINIGIPVEKITYIGNAVNLPEAYVRESHNSVTILFLTRIVIEKGIIELIDAFLLLKRKYKDLNLRIVGGESLDKSIVKQHIQENDLDRTINYIGPVSDEQKNIEYVNADIFAFPTYVEDQSYAIMEAMSYGLPCVASNVGGVPSLITHGENGLLIEAKDVRSLGEALEMLYLDPHLRKKIGNTARKTIEEGFTWKIRSQEIISLYNKILTE